MARVAEDRRHEAEAEEAGHDDGHQEPPLQRSTACSNLRGFQAAQGAIRLRVRMLRDVHSFHRSGHDHAKHLTGVPVAAECNQGIRAYF